MDECGQRRSRGGEVSVLAKHKFSIKSQERVRLLKSRAG
jgi:hypothetical protein